MVRADRFLGRLALAARPGRPLLRVTASPWLARVLLAAGAQRGQPADAMSVSYPGSAAPAEPGAAAGEPVSAAAPVEREAAAGEPGPAAAPAEEQTAARKLRPVPWAGPLTGETARRDLALAVLAARRARRLAVSALLAGDPDSFEARADLVVHMRNLLQALLVVTERAAQIEEGRGRTRIETLHPQGYPEAHAIGRRLRAGITVIMDLTEVDYGDAKRLMDFAAGLIFGLRGTIDRVTTRVYLLSPGSAEAPGPDEIADVSPLRQMEAARAAIATVASVLKGLNVPLTGFPEADEPVEDPAEEEIAPGAAGPPAFAARLQRLALPLDLSGIDLTGITLLLADLTGAIWTSDTRWPSAAVAGQVRGISEELSPGTYRVSTGTQPTSTGIRVTR